MMNNLIRNLLFVGILLLIISSFDREEVIITTNGNKYVRYVMTEDIDPKEMYTGLRDWFYKVREIVWPELDEFVGGAESGADVDSQSGFEHNAKSDIELGPELSPTSLSGPESAVDHKGISVQGRPAQDNAQGDGKDNANDNASVMPVSGEITGLFGWRVHPVTGDWSFHEGIDIRARKGIEISAWKRGRVERVWTSQTYGLTVILNHDDGFRSLYAHCSDILVKPGDTVEAGETIAKVGDTGQATGSHLHFGILEEGLARDPELFI